MYIYIYVCSTCADQHVMGESRRGGRAIGTETGGQGLSLSAATAVSGLGFNHQRGHGMAWHGMEWHGMAWPGLACPATLHFTTLHYTSLHFTSLRFTRLH